MIKKIIIYSLILLTSACSTYYGRYQHKYDSTPARIPTSAELVDATPHAEIKSRGGNIDYTVRGKSYQVLATADNFEQTGIASYYGQKFHGHLTSNGEIYNMYSMSAAHKSLPLPSYVKVTNTDNNKSVIVRVNDRGPFHQNRIIDLSYSAAYKLGMLKTGTAPVKITAITQFVKQVSKHPTTSIDLPVINTTVTQTSATTKNNTDLTNKNNYFIQVFATQNNIKAKNTASALSALYQLPVTWLQNNGIFRVQIGPINGTEESSLLLTNLRKNGYPQAFLRKTTP